MDDFSVRLKRLMDLRDVNQTQLANLADITPASVSLYLKGSRMPQLPTLLKLADALDISLPELTGYEPNTRKDLNSAVEIVVCRCDQLSQTERIILLRAVMGLA